MQQDLSPALVKEVEGKSIWLSHGCTPFAIKIKLLLPSNKQSEYSSINTALSVTGQGFLVFYRQKIIPVNQLTNRFKLLLTINPPVKHDRRYTTTTKRRAHRAYTNP
ncbi:hypothetical protein C8P68_104327 [Mucilaginibacter yixingensis]|uniref:Uncharacterized protein n=1 Tax=Mucilaginibacter yixingensis TaxID=1295612 RepID=A0A2T5J9U5_9SPHI|nr:hypothetical protein C8P68_104327 [Mucilaginibacter yixingensis]